MGKMVDLPAAHVSKLARDIESANLHTFEKTPLGSFLFKIEEKELIVDYFESLSFIKKKEYALELIKESIQSNKVPTKPEWINRKHLKNAKFIN